MRFPFFLTHKSGKNLNFLEEVSEENYFEVNFFVSPDEIGSFCRKR